jgi:hypothetical protein
MKTKTSATAASATLELTHPQQIIDRHLRPAIAPFKAELLEAAARDRELSAELERKHPETAKREALELLEKAGAGDTEADKILTEAGGTEAYVKSRAALFDLTRAKHEAACISSAPLWQKVSDAILAAIEAADREIQGQWSKVCDFLGEPCDLSRWNSYCRNIRNGIERAPFAAEKLRHGTDWQIESLGLRPLLD